MTPGRPELDPLRALNDIIGTSVGHVDLDELLETTLKRACEVFEVDTATVLRHEASGRHLIPIAAVGLEEEVYQGVRIPVGVGFAGRVAAIREPVVIDHVDDSTVSNALLWDRGLKTMLGVPMLAGADLVGVLHVGCVQSRRFGAADVEAVRLLADRLAVAVQLDVLREDRAATRALQRSLLPGVLPDIPGLDFAARYVPGAETGLGGDWYDLFRLPGDRLGVVMGDVSGHGLDAAVIMGRLRSALRAYALDCEDPAEVLDKLDRKANHFEHGAMATVAYGVFERGHDRLSLSLAGHLPPVLAAAGRPGELVKVPADPPIGLTIGTPRRRTTVLELPPESILAFYTDGLVERRDQLVDIGMQQLTGLVRVEDPSRLCGRVMSALVGTRPAQDDVALLVIRRVPAEPR